MTSTPVYTSTAEGFRDAKEIAGLRAIPESKPRAPRRRKFRAPVAGGIVCRCGERFGDDEAREFMLHLRAEVGKDLAVLDNYRKRNAKGQLNWRRKPGVAERLRDKASERYAADPRYRERKLEQQRRYQAKPEIQERMRSPEFREQMNAYGRAYRARIKALHDTGDHSRCPRRCAVRRELDAPS